ncbi:MAG: hypothetical protein ACTSQY_00320 [Candidatus Odinarchaeia archaeon]|nr:MAG: hypothetical protein [Lokiarchaeota virus Fenrir Meg22_1012]URC17243.1 MAG: hypothetical protein [Lokiarchaeota virus Fenrir Meg22_1214]
MKEKCVKYEYRIFRENLKLFLKFENETPFNETILKTWIKNLNDTIFVCPCNIKGYYKDGYPAGCGILQKICDECSAKICKECIWNIDFCEECPRARLYVRIIAFCNYTKSRLFRTRKLLVQKLLAQELQKILEKGDKNFLER